MAVDLKHIHCITNLHLVYNVQSALTFNPTKSFCVVFRPRKLKLYCPHMVLNGAPYHILV